MRLNELKLSCLLIFAARRGLLHFGYFRGAAVARLIANTGLAFTETDHDSIR